MVHGPINRVPFMGERETFKGWWFIALNLGRQRFSLGANIINKRRVSQAKNLG
jgi:hypothetical protein